MATLQQVATFLRASPKSYDTLTAGQKTTFREVLAPKLAGFDGEQRTWFRDWWFVATQAQVDAINAALPRNVQVQPVLYNGTLYLNIDIATDCLQSGDTYFAARSVFRALVCTNVPNLPDLLEPDEPPKPEATIKE